MMAGAVLASVMALGACAPKPAAPPPKIVAPPPTPIKPYPPMGASPHMVIPPAGPDGLRHTINTGLGPEQTTWNLRSAFNVAALNCQRPEHATILDGYKNFLKVHDRGLRSVNSALDKQFRAEYGSTYIRQRESYNTQVYNYFALPPTLPAFCDAAVVVSQQSLGVGPADLAQFAANGLAQFESVFNEFYNAYDQYRYDLAVWNQRYGTPEQGIAAGPVAVAPEAVLATQEGTQTVSQPVVQEVGPPSGEQ
jgi:hypothetical protein